MTYEQDMAVREKYWYKDGSACCTEQEVKQ